MRCVAQDAIKNVDATLTPTRAAEVQIKGHDCANGSTYDDCRDPIAAHPKSTPTPGYPPNAGPCGNDSISIDCGESMDAGAPKAGGPAPHAPGWENGCTEDDPCPAGGETHGPKEGRHSP